jgi:hypothetical protein
MYAVFPDKKMALCATLQMHTALSELTLNYMSKS